MKKLFCITLVLFLFCLPCYKLHGVILYDSTHIAISQEAVTESIKIIYKEFNDFDRESFLLGTMDDNMGHYQTFTANKSFNEIDDNVKWIFKKGVEFRPDTMAQRRITTYTTKGEGSWHTGLALVVVELFKKDHADLRVLRMCYCSYFIPTRRLSGGEVKSLYDLNDSICKKNPDFPILPQYEIELYSSSLAKAIAGYYQFDLENPFLPVISSGGDIGYRGVINREKISTQAQKISFLMGVFMRYGYGRLNDQYGSDCYSISIPNSLSTARICIEILQEMGCEHVAYIDKLPWGHQIFCTFSLEVDKVKRLIDRVQKELYSKLIAY